MYGSIKMYDFKLILRFGQRHGDSAWAESGKQPYKRHLAGLQ